MKCPNCGEEITNAKFCRFCGVNVSDMMFEFQKKSNHNEKPKKKRKMVKAAIIVAMIGIIAIAIGCFYKSQNSEVIELDNPQIEGNKVTNSGQVTTWDCIEFGSYPQAEVICFKEEYDAIKVAYLEENDLIISKEIFTQLEQATGWNEKNEIELDGKKYKRLKKEDASYYDLENERVYKWNDEYHYFLFEPIKWRVLSVEGDEVVLLSDMILDSRAYNDKDEMTTWEKCTMRKWLNGLDEYNEDGFINQAFNEYEKNLIVNSLNKNKNNSLYSTYGGDDTNDRVFLLAEQEVCGTEVSDRYGFFREADCCDEARFCRASTYAKALGSQFITAGENQLLSGYSFWWLRTAGQLNNCAQYAVDGVNFEGITVNEYYNIGVRPAIRVKLEEEKKFSYVGKICSVYNAKDKSSVEDTVDDAVHNTLRNWLNSDIE